MRNLEFELESKKKEISERDRDKSLLESTIADKDKKLKDVEARELQAKKEIDDAKRDQDTLGSSQAKIGASMPSAWKACCSGARSSSSA